MERSQRKGGDRGASEEAWIPSLGGSLLCELKFRSVREKSVGVLCSGDQQRPGTSERYVLETESIHRLKMCFL